MQGLDSDMEKLADFLSVPKYAQIKRENKISIHLETENICFVNQNLGHKLRFLPFQISNVHKSKR